MYYTMKIRNGFVSNSSSASYIIEIHGIELDTFLETLDREYSWLKFNKDDIEKEVKEQYKKTKALVNSGGRFYGLGEGWLKEAEERKQRVETAKTRTEFVQTVLWLRGIRITEKDTSIELYGYTSMHNSFEDMPDLLREIILYFLMDTTHKITARRIDESE